MCPDNALKIFDDTKIYIFCPANAVSGGPDALHQLAYYLNTLGYTARLVYYFTGITKCEERFEKYTPQVILYDEIIDSAENVVIAPESATWILKRYKKSRKCIWWLSDIFYDGYNSRFVSASKNIIKFFLNIFKAKKYNYACVQAPIKITKDIYNFCGSKYVYEKLVNKKLQNIEMLVEPLSLDFLRYGMAANLSAAERSDIIAYNPAKPSEIMAKLLQRSDLQFVPIRGMQLSEIIELFRHTKLYVDFGEFGGPERLPKESVYNGTCLLVGKRNAAVNDFDVAIPDKYKIENYNDEETVVTAMKDVLKNYDQYIDDFQSFRDKVDHLEENFVKSIKTIFYRV